MIFWGSFYIKTTKCYNLDAYQAKKCKQKKVDLTVHRPDYRKYLSYKYYKFPINDLPHRPPSKKSEKSGKKFQAKAILGHIPWLNSKKNLQISFSQYVNNVGTPFFLIYVPGSKYRYPCTQSAGGVPK